MLNYTEQKLRKLKMPIKLTIQSLFLYLWFILSTVLATDVVDEFEDKKLSKINNPGDFQFFKELPTELI